VYGPGDSECERIERASDLEADKRACELALRERRWYGLEPLPAEPVLGQPEANPAREVNWQAVWGAYDCESFGDVQHRVMAALQEYDRQRHGKAGE
jgi:broad specificity phosphatase PhoE